MDFVEKEKEELLGVLLAADLVTWEYFLDCLAKLKNANSLFVIDVVSRDQI